MIITEGTWIMGVLPEGSPSQRVHEMMLTSMSGYKAKIKGWGEIYRDTNCCYAANPLKFCGLNQSAFIISCNFEGPNQRQLSQKTAVGPQVKPPSQFSCLFTWVLSGDFSSCYMSSSEGCP